MKKQITFDAFVRGLTIILALVAGYFLLRSLRAVLLPFFVAWLLAYVIYPLVHFLQYKCRLRFRILCIILALTLFMAVVGGILALTVPATLREIAHLRGEIVNMVQSFGQSRFASDIDMFLRLNLDEKTLTDFFQDKDVVDIMQIGTNYLWTVITNAFSFLKGVVGSLLVLLYLFFILMDYERLAKGFVHLVPEAHRETAAMVLKDVQHNMHAYFRGQSLIALIVGVMFSVGFAIIGLPMAVALGMFIGVLNLVPYLQTLGVIPALMLCFMKSNQTGESFWLLVLYCFILFLIVQGTQDIFLTPRIMGKIMGLRPAVILLSLSVWGSLLGFIGLIIALPLTTLLVSYYKLFILKEGPVLRPRPFDSANL